MFGSTMPPRDRSSCPDLIRASINRQRRWIAGSSPAMTKLASGALLPPHLIGDVDRELQLGPLLFLGEDVAFLGGSKAALRRYRELIERCEFGCLFQPALDVVL